MDFKPFQIFMYGSEQCKNGGTYSPDPSRKCAYGQENGVFYLRFCLA